MYGNDKDVDGSQLAAMVLPEDEEGSNDSLNNSEYFGDHNIMSEDIIANYSNVQREDGNEDGNEMKDAVWDINTGSKRIRDDPTDSPAPLTQGSQPNAVNIRRLRSGNKEGTSSGRQCSGIGSQHLHDGQSLHFPGTICGLFRQQCGPER